MIINTLLKKGIAVVDTKFRQFSLAIKVAAINFFDKI